MENKTLFEKIRKLLNLKKDDKIIHLCKDKTIFLEMLQKYLSEFGHIYSINLSKIKNKSFDKNISFHTAKDKLNLKSETIDLILIENTLSNISDLKESFSQLKKYLTERGKILIYRKKSIFFFPKKLHEAMFLSGFRLKNKLFLEKFVLEIYEQE